jgi:hypothetical protein
VIYEPSSQGIEFPAHFRRQDFLGFHEIAEHPIGLALVLEADPLNGRTDGQRRPKFAAKISRKSLAARHGSGISQAA